MKPQRFSLSLIGLLLLAAGASGAIITTNVAPTGAIIDSSPAYNSSFAVTNVLDGRTDEATNSPATYWIAPDGATNAYFILDLRRDYLIKSIALFNTHNRQFNDRGTGQFEVDAGNGVEPNPVSGSVDRYYSFDGDVNDRSGNNVNGTALDASGSPSVGTFSSSVSAAVKTGQAITFSGAGEDVEITDPFQPTSFSISLWVKLDSIQASGFILRTASSGNQGSTWSHQLRLNAGSNFEAYLWDGAGKTVTGTTVAQPNTWYHVAATSINGGLMHLYVNGTEEGTPVTIGTMWTGGSLWALGTSWGSGASPLAGSIDELGIWFTSPLTPALIKRLSNGEKPPAVINSSAAPQGLRLVQPQLILSGTLTDVSGQDQIQPDVFTATNGLKQVTARYVEFKTISADNTNNNVGLNEIQIITDVDDTPPTVGIASAVLVSWPYNPFGYILQSSPTLSPATWTAVSVQPSLSDTNLTLFLPAANRSLFYRLSKP
jgi:Concanavalin A-like lectin/glucanases superfamily